MRHNHVITIRHFDNDVLGFECDCGEGMVGVAKVIGAMIIAHRLANFPYFRHRMEQ